MSDMGTLNIDVYVIHHALLDEIQSHLPLFLLLITQYLILIVSIVIWIKVLLLYISIFTIFCYLVWIAITICCHFSKFRGFFRGFAFFYCFFLCYITYLIILNKNNKNAILWIWYRWDYIKKTILYIYNKLFTYLIVWIL
jgi:hypothetical protein